MHYRSYPPNQRPRASTHSGTAERHTNRQYTGRYSNPIARTVKRNLCQVDNKNNYIRVYFTPTIPHCSMATLIGLCLRVKLLRSLPRRFKVLQVAQVRIAFFFLFSQSCSPKRALFSRQFVHPPNGGRVRHAWFPRVGRCGK